MDPKLNPIQLDALREVGNIGSGNAATALASFLETEIHMAVPDVKLLPLEDIPGMMGGEEKALACVMVKVIGDISGCVLFITEEEGMYGLLKMVFAGQEKIELGELEVSAMMEIGNIITGSFLTAINQLTGLSCHQSLPGFAFDMAGALLSTVALQQLPNEDKVLFIESFFSQGSHEISTWLFLLPCPGSLEKLLHAIGVDDYEGHNPG